MRLTEGEIVARTERMSVRRLRVWVRNGWISPADSEGGPSFDEVDLARVRLVCQLKAEMDLSDNAVPVVLSLIDQLHGMRRQLKGIAAAIDRQPEETRRQMLRALHELTDT